MASWKKIAGTILVVAGVMALFLPFIPGTVMIVAGLAVFGNGKMLNWAKSKFRKNKQ